MGLGIDWDADLEQITDDLAATVTFSGTNYSCIVGAVSNAANLAGIEGPLAEDAVVVVLRTSLISGTRPTVNDTITTGGVVYRIVRVETDEADAALNLYCEEKTA